MWWTQIMRVYCFSYLECAVTQFFDPVHTVVFERSKHHCSVLCLHTKGRHVVLQTAHTEAFTHPLQLLSSQKCFYFFFVLPSWPSAFRYLCRCSLKVCCNDRFERFVTSLQCHWWRARRDSQTVATVVMWHTWIAAQTLTMGQASAFGGNLTTLRRSDNRITLSFLSKWCWWCLLIPTLWSPPAPPPLGSKTTPGVTKWPQDANTFFLFMMMVQCWSCCCGVADALKGGFNCLIWYLVQVHSPRYCENNQQNLFLNWWKSGVFPQNIKSYVDWINQVPLLFQIQPLKLSGQLSKLTAVPTVPIKVPSPSTAHSMEPASSNMRTWLIMTCTV